MPSGHLLGSESPFLTPNSAKVRPAGHGVQRLLGLQAQQAETSMLAEQQPGAGVPGHASQALHPAGSPPGGQCRARDVLAPDKIPHVPAPPTAAALAGLSESKVARGLAGLKHVPTGTGWGALSLRERERPCDPISSPTAKPAPVRMCQGLCSGHRGSTTDGCGHWTSSRSGRGRGERGGQGTGASRAQVTRQDPAPLRPHKAASQGPALLQSTSTARV